MWLTSLYTTTVTDFCQLYRRRSFISRNGVSMLGISDAAESIGFRTSGVRVSFEQLAEDVPLPCILHWNQSHFVVCYDVKKKKGQYSFRIADPATQLVTYNELELKRCWLATKSDGEEKGTALALEPTPDFYNGEGEPERVVSADIGHVGGELTSAYPTFSYASLGGCGYQ